MDNSESDTDDELPLDSSDVYASAREDFDPGSIDVQPTDAVKLLLAETTDSLHTVDSALQASESETTKSDIEYSSSDVLNELGGADDDSEMSVDWQQQNLHVFVLSEAGKPIYSRHGDESHLASIMGVMQALVSFVAASGDELQSINAGEKVFVFLCRPHLILVAVGQKFESHTHLIVCLGYVYSQILSLLTLRRLNERFDLRKNLDLRRLLIGDRRLISSIIDFAEDSFGAFLQAVGYVPMAQQTRDHIAQIISQSVKSRTVVFGLLLHQKHLVSMVCMKGRTLQPMDVHLIVNLVSTSEAIKSGTTHWLPICLPKFDANGFLYANIAFLDEATSLVLLSVDSSQFYALDEARNTVFERLRSTNNGELLRSISSVTFPTLSEIGIPELRHIVCKFIPAPQYVSSDWAPFYVDHFVPNPASTADDAALYPYEQFASNSKSLRHRILCSYRRMHARLHNPSYPTRLVFQTTPTEAFLAWRIDTFEMYCTLEPLTTRIALIEIRKSLLRWVTSRKLHIFSLSTSTF